MICKRCERAYDYLTADYLCEDCDELLRLRLSNGALNQELADIKQAFSDMQSQKFVAEDRVRELEQELATEREKVGKLREFATLVKETSESVFQSSYRTNFNKYFLMFINKAATLLEEGK